MKFKPQTLKYTLDETLQMISFIKKELNSRLFTLSRNDLSSMLSHVEVVFGFLQVRFQIGF